LIQCTGRRIRQLSGFGGRFSTDAIQPNPKRP
jgi:hypothetical protein